MTKKNAKMIKYDVEFECRYSFESIGSDDKFIESRLNDEIEAANLVDAYTIANDMLGKINSVNPTMVYVITRVQQI